MPLKTNLDGSQEIIKCKGYCQTGSDKVCHNEVCRVFKNKKKEEEKNINRIGWDILQEVQKNLY